MPIGAAHLRSLELVIHRQQEALMAGKFAVLSFPLGDLSFINDGYGYLKKFIAAIFDELDFVEARVSYCEALVGFLIFS
jgi:hypothetical protein